MPRRRRVRRQPKPRWSPGITRLDALLNHPLVRLGGLILTVAALTTLLAKGPADSWRWLEERVPPLRDAAEEKVLTNLIAGADLGEFERKLGPFTFKHGDGPFVEYIFVTRHAFVQAIAKKNDNRVLLWAVTLRKKGLRPIFEWPAPNGGAAERAVSPIVLGETRFSEWGLDCKGQPYSEIQLDGVVGTSSGDLYVESMALCHADDFAQVLVAISPAGIHTFDDAVWERRAEVAGVHMDDWPFPIDAAIRADDLKSPDIMLWRSSNVINTYGEAAPEFALSDMYQTDGAPKYEILVGPSREQVSAFAVREGRSGN